MTGRISNRWRAAALHLAIGAVVLLAALSVIRFAWYPRHFYEIQQAARTLPVLVGICLLLGPLLTLVVFKSGKKGLRFDLYIIATLQIAALAFAMHRLYVERPFFLVFAVDRFNVLAAQDVDTMALGDARFLDKPWGDLVKVVARMPNDPSEVSRLTMEVLLEGKPDLERRPEYWLAYVESFHEVIDVARSVRLLKEMQPASAGEIDRVVSAAGLSITDLLFVPVMGKRDNYVVFVRKSDGALLGELRLEQGL